jgi:hypothetical protein
MYGHHGKVVISLQPESLLRKYPNTYTHQGSVT